MARSADLAAQWLRRLYRALPLSWPQRMALKHWIFRAFAPLLSRTAAYRRWYYYSRMQSNTYLPPGVRPPASRDAPAGERYMAQLAAQAEGSRSTEYVSDPATRSPTVLKAKAIAFYLPQFHPIPENDAWWGAGFTEWTNVGKAVPRFVGHEQPKLPGELGYYDLRLQSVMRRQAELARLHGVHGFCFYYYWFSGRRLLETPLENFLADDGIDLPFCICWANESWTRRWDGRSDQVLLEQAHGEGDDLRFIEDAARCLKDARCIRIDGRPLLIVYRPTQLPDALRSTAVWRDYCREAGIGEIFLAMVQHESEDPIALGFDAAIEFPPHGLRLPLEPINNRLDIVDPHYAGMVQDYEALAAAAAERTAPTYPLFRGVCPGWDNEARRPGRGFTFANASPAVYRDWLESAVDHAQRHTVASESVVFINAWNEWAEGAYLEPDQRYGYAYLHATRLALQGAGTPRMRIALMCHDANAHGAQYLALNLTREFRRLDQDVEVLLLGEGVLEDAFASLVKTHRLFELDASAIAELARSLRKRGFTALLANTAVSGRVIAPFRDAGFRIVSLIHELPGLISDYALQEPVRALTEASERMVVPADVVRRGVESFLLQPPPPGRIVRRPQGLYTRSRYRGLHDATRPRTHLRQRIGVPDDAEVILAVGYADRRKGVDLMVQVAAHLVAARDSVHIVWVGDREPTIREDVDAAILVAGLQRRIHFVGADFDTDDYFAGADVYALLSREDPFPTVALESLAVGVPVVAFRGTGGIADLIEHSLREPSATGQSESAQSVPGTDGHGVASERDPADFDRALDAALAGPLGAVAPAFDAEAYAAAVLRLLEDDALRARCAASARALVDGCFGFRRYALDLLDMLGLALPRVSAVVPNYNYSRYLPERLRSVSSQRFPPAELLLLDDASSDNSIQVFLQHRDLLHPEPILIRNEVNSGSVFRQWREGVRRASGDFVWIAEADDVARPELLGMLIDAMRADDSIVMAYAQSEQIDADGVGIAPDYHGYTDPISTRRWRAAYVASGVEEANAGLAIKNTIPNVSAVLFRREPLLRVLEQHGEEIAAYRVAGDWALYLHLLLAGRVAFVPQALNRHRRHRGGVTQDTELRRHWDEVRAVQALAQRLYPVEDAVVAAAADYADALGAHFGLRNA
jgi:glycosyltransferase involved in cell wall biosynthesis/GT2 family glycosyltransferase